jgi:hypothetical protein
MRWALASFLAGALLQLASCSGMSADGDQTAPDLSGSQCVDKPLWRVTLEREQTIHRGDDTRTYRICERKKAGWAAIPLLRPWVRLKDATEVPLPFQVQSEENCVDVTSATITVFARKPAESVGALARPLIGCYIDLGIQDP